MLKRLLKFLTGQKEPQKELQKELQKRVVKIKAEKKEHQSWLKQKHSFDGGGLLVDAAD